MTVHSAPDPKCALCLYIIAQFQKPLQSIDGLKGFLKHGPLDDAQLIRVDVVVRNSSLAEDIDVMPYPGEHDDIERISQIVGLGRGESLFFNEGRNPVEGIRFEHLLAEGECPDGIDQGSQAVQLQIELILVLSGLFDHQPLKEAQGRFVKNSGLGHFSRKAISLIKKLQDMPCCLGHQLILTVDGAAIEKDEGGQDLLGGVVHIGIQCLKYSFHT